ncbi:MAG: HAD-IIIA family hydrolase [Mariprofundus sp.]|nr:HAD-IIIA family hydrolase [Mariprofundus sp.]
MSSEPALILFDCDGTMTDSHGIIVQAMQAAFQQAGLNAPEHQAVCDIIGLSLTQAIRRLIVTDQSNKPALQQHIAEAYRQHYILLEDQVELFPHVRQTLERLRASGYWLGVVTGKSKAGLKRVLQRFDLNDLFYVLRTADCTHSKPHPAMVLECMQELGITAEQTCVVGDAVFDIQMAKAASVQALGVSFGVASSTELMQAGASHVVTDFSDLLNFFPHLQDASLSPTMADHT